MTTAVRCGLQQDERSAIPSRWMRLGDRDRDMAHRHGPESVERIGDEPRARPHLVDEFCAASTFARTASTSQKQ